MSFISQPEVCFIAFYSEIMLHGMYTVLFLMTMYLLVFTRKKSRLQIVLSIVTLAMYGIATAHSALYLKQVLETFMNAESSGSFDLNEVSSPIEYTKVALEVINCTIADSVFLWRAWILSGKNTWCCLVPCGLLLGSAVAGFGMVYESSKANGSIVFLRQVAGHWTISWVTLTLTTNIVITGLVTYQAWNLRRQSGPTMANSVLFRLIECGILYSLSFIVLLILFVVGLNASYVLNHMIPQITGIYPTFFFVLVDLQMTMRDLFAHESNMVSHRSYRLRCQTPHMDTVKVGTTYTLDDLKLSLRGLEVTQC